MQVMAAMTLHFSDLPKLFRVCASTTAGAVLRALPIDTHKCKTNPQQRLKDSVRPCKDLISTLMILASSRLNCDISATLREPYTFSATQG